MTVEEVMTELRKELIFMEESGGGVTFSGGEPLLQYTFLTELLASCQMENIHTTVDTSGYATWEVMEKVARHTDLFLYDLKVMDDDLHKTYTGVSNKLILENVSRLLIMGNKVRIRLPMIPGISFTDSNINDTINFLIKLNRPIEGIDLLPYHNTASHKYERLGLENTLQQLKAVDRNELLEVKKQFESAGFEVKIGG